MEGEGTTASQCCLMFKYPSGLTLGFRVVRPVFCAVQQQEDAIKTKNKNKELETRAPEAISLVPGPW